MLQLCLYFGFVISCLNSSISPVSLSNTAPAISLIISAGKHCVAYCLEVTVVLESSMVDKMMSCVNVLALGPPCSCIVSWWFLKIIFLCDDGFWMEAW